MAFRTWDCASSDRAVPCRSDGNMLFCRRIQIATRNGQTTIASCWEAGPAPCRRARRTSRASDSVREERDSRKPGDVVRRMIRHKIHDHADVALFPLR